MLAAWPPTDSRSGCAAWSSASARSPPSTASTSTCPTGICVGLLGPNGAGKSTTMRLLTGAGDRRRGRAPGARPRAARASRSRRAPRWASCRSSTTSTRRDGRAEPGRLRHLYRVPKAERAAAIERALDIAKLGDRRDAKVDELSGGMRRRLLIARALVHQPRLVLLDEPTVGLDPQVRQELWSLIDGLRSEGTTILMSTHYIEEAERLCDNVTIMIARPGGRASAARRADRRARRAARRSRSTARPRGWRRPRRRWRARASRRGAPARRSPCCASTTRGGRAPAGERRAANLEDVFVLLTGEEIG